jgi:hypothetical protein
MLQSSRATFGMGKEKGLEWTEVTSCVLGCTPLGHHCGPNHPFVFMVVPLLAIVVAMVILLCS